MQACPTDIITSLRQQILSHQGYRPGAGKLLINAGLSSILESFPNQQIPLSAIHEFICTQPESMSATNGFIAAMLSSLMQQGGACIWISAAHKTFPASLPLFGIQPHRVIFVHVPKEKDVLWITEEALKCNGLAAVVGEITDINFTQSRRLQLAVEKSRVNGFIFRRNPRNLVTTACAARWKITPLPGTIEDDLPGVGVTRWNIELLKVRNGKPGIWQLEWYDGRFRPVYPIEAMIQEPQRKVI